MAKARPKTGERRKTNQPVKIDRLPQTVQDSLLVLRNRLGKSWLAIEEQSARPYSKDWEKDGGGFIDWDNIDTDVLELFPELKLPHSNLHRWYDIRIVQVHDQKMKEAERAHVWADRFAKDSLKGSSEAVVNAMQAEVFNLMQNVSDADQGKFLGGLNALALVMMRLRRLELQERKATLEERRIKELEQTAALQRRRLERELDSVEKKTAKGGVVTTADINKIRQRIFGLAPEPVQKGVADVAQG